MIRVIRFALSRMDLTCAQFLDKWLADMAVQSGAEVKDNTAPLFCEEENGIDQKCKGEQIYIEQSRYVIACEGVGGALKRNCLAAICNT